MQPRPPARACTLLGLALLALSAGPARAQQPAAEDATPPPAAEDASHQAAERLFTEGTAWFKQWRFDEAEQKFREALTHRDHPLVHLYLSRTLEKQGRLVEAHEALMQALRPGAEPKIPAEDAQEAKKLRARLESRLAQIEVHCDTPGTEVSLDAELWFTTPGRPRRMIDAGRHVIVAHKPGYFPVARQVSLLPGMRTHVVLRMTADVTHVERRWQPWKPRAVAGAGIGLSLTGGLLLLQARSDYDALRRELAACNGEPTCGQLPPSRLDRGDRNRTIGTVALLAGGATLAAGLAGMVINLPHTRRSEPARGIEDLDFLPMVSPDTAGVSLQLQF